MFNCSKFSFVQNFQFFKIFNSSKFSFFKIFNFSKFSFVQNLHLSKIFNSSKFAILQNLQFFKICNSLKFAILQTLQFIKIFTFISSKFHFLWNFHFSKYSMFQIVHTPKPIHHTPHTPHSPFTVSDAVNFCFMHCGHAPRGVKRSKKSCQIRFWQFKVLIFSQNWKNGKNAKNDLCFWQYFGSLLSFSWILALQTNKFVLSTTLLWD